MAVLARSHEKKTSSKQGNRGSSKEDVRSKSRLVHSVIDIVVDPIIHRLNLFLQVLREQDYVLIFLIDDVVKSRVHHPDDLCRLVADNLVRLLVVQRGHREAALVVWVLLKVDVAEMCVSVVQPVRFRGAWDLLVGRGKAPSLFAHVPVHAVVRNDVFETLEVAYNQCPVRPWAGIRDVEMVSAFFWWEFGIGLVLDPVSKH